MPTDQQLTTPGMVLGSPHFISPERAMGAAFGPPSDLFSLGVTLFAAVEGRPPFDKGEPIATMHAVVEDPPLPPQRAGALTEVLYGLLEKDPARRWDATRARRVLRDLLAGPLASRTPMFPTDPYAVVQTQTVSPAAANGGERVGGRALLDPGELPTDRMDPYRAVADPYAQPFEPDTVVTPAVGGSSERVRAVASSTGSWLMNTVRRMPGGVQVGVAAALTAIVLLGVVIAIASRGDTPGSNAAPPATTAPTTEPPADTPPFEVQPYSGRGIEINLPAQWQGIDNERLVYVDFVDPADASVGVRLLAEEWSGDAPRLIEVAEGNIQSNPACPAYQRVAITEVEAADRAGAQLEYTCGEGVELRRARWVTVVADGTAYSFRFTAPEAIFAERQAIFDELLRSFQVTG
jgi:hypothetical protein